MKKQVRRKMLLLALIVTLGCIVGMRCAEEGEVRETDFLISVAAGAAELAAEGQEVSPQMADKLENAEMPAGTEPPQQESPASEQVAEPDIEDTYGEAAEYIAKTVYGEAWICDTTERAAVIWCILNRADSIDPYYPECIIEVIAQPYQFHGYDAAHPVKPELYELALDVIGRWLQERDGETDVGRVLPREYLFFSGDGAHNHFRTQWSGGTEWDWSLPSPYEE